MSVAETAPARFAGIGHEEWAVVLRDAARVGLLADLGSSRYQIHPALPGYLAVGWGADSPDGYDQERQACEQALRSACADFSRWLTGQIAAGEATLAYTVIGLQRRTFGAMLGHALDHHAWADADGIVRALDAYWDARGLGGEADAWADRILAATAGPGQDPPVPARSLWLYVTMHRATRQNHAGQQEKAAQTYQRALAYLQGQSATDWTRKNISAIYHQLGFTAQARASLGEADVWYRKSLAIREELDDRPGMAIAYHELGRTAQARGRLDEADDWYRKSLAIKEELGNRPGMAATYHQLGWIAQDRGRLDEADDWYRKSLAIKEELGDRRLIAGTRHQLGNTALLSGRLEEADEWYLSSLTISELLGNRPVMAGTYHQLGMTAQARGRLEEADEWYHRSLHISEELGNHLHMAANHLQLGMTAQARGRLDEADDWYRKSLHISEELDDRPGMANAYAQFGRLAEARAQAPQALAWNVRSVTLFSQFPSPFTEIGSSALARLTRHLGMPALEQAWQQVTGQPLPERIRDYITSQLNGESPRH